MIISIDQKINKIQHPFIIKTLNNKTLANYFVDIDKLILRFIWRGKRGRIPNTILNEN